MYLNEIFSKAPEVLIEQLSIDSRMPMQNAIFFCISGVVYNGHKFVKEAIENGARVIIYEEDIDTGYNAIFIRVSDTISVLNRVANYFYGYPAKEINSYVVSGCYGKSMVNYILSNLLSRYEKTGYVGERGIYDGNHDYLNTARTLTIIDLYRNLYKMKENKVKSAVFESSVLNLNYKKLDGITPKAFIYTTTGEESVEYRETNKKYEEYLFDYMRRLDRSTLMIINTDDPLFEDMTRNTNNLYLTYGKSENSDFRISSVNTRPNGSDFNIITEKGKYHVETKLTGISSIYNLTAVLAALSQRFEMVQLIEYINDIKPLTGSCSYIDEGQNYNIFIDSAGSYQTISRVYDFAREVSNGKRIISVIPVNYIDNAMKLSDLMSLSAEVCSLVILTSGDTYGKDISELLEKAQTFIPKSKCIVIEDRQSAIEIALDSANSGDTVLLLGKGDDHYIYKSNGKVKYDSDEVIVKRFLKKNEENIDDCYFDL